MSYPTYPPFINHACSCIQFKIRGQNWFEGGLSNVFALRKQVDGYDTVLRPAFNSIMSYPSIQDEQILACLTPAQQVHYNQLVADSNQLRELFGDDPGEDVELTGTLGRAMLYFVGAQFEEGTGERHTRQYHTLYSFLTRFTEAVKYNSIRFTHNPA